MKSLLSELAEIHTPYGATEALPVSDACDTDLLAITGSNPFLKGICVGKPLPGMRVRIVKIDDGIIKHLKDKNILPDNQIGEIIVNGPVVTHEYLNNEEANTKNSEHTRGHKVLTNSKRLFTHPFRGTSCDR